MNLKKQCDWSGWWISDKRMDFTMRHVCWFHIGKVYSPEIPGAIIYKLIIGPLNLSLEID